MIINDLNLKKLKASILEIKNVEDLLELNKKVIPPKQNIMVIVLELLKLFL